MEEQIDILRIIERKDQAYEAMKIIVGADDIHILTSNIGTHKAIWVTWTDPVDGETRVRQYSWLKGQNTEDGHDLQWCYDAFHKYGTLMMMIKHTTWKDDEEETNYFI